jgi:polyketide biosynthesis 3-hydroxy-3-methylglutaryl-CoA synthase-like enzyme PksG
MWHIGEKMTDVGIEAMNVYGGSAYVNVMELARHRGLEWARFENLMMHEKAVALPCEDPITYAANAAKPIVDALSSVEKSRIELLITCSESGIDFAKSMSTYLSQYLGLSRNCRLFEIKQACYAGTAGFQMAVNFILSQASPGAKALVIATDISRYVFHEGGNVDDEDWSYAEPSAGAGAIALLVSETPVLFQIDVGANGIYGYEVMDTCRPVADNETGNSELSLLSYLDCCENAFLDYQRRVEDADYRNTFQYLAFHTPFGGMVKGAHRTMMRKLAKAKPDEIAADFNRRVMPGMSYCQRIGNAMGATVFVSLAGIIDSANVVSPQRVGCFSYGSGCCSEFYSGIISKESQRALKRFNIKSRLDQRYKLGMDEYDDLLRTGSAVKFGTRDAVIERPEFIKGNEQVSILVLQKISNFHREYAWI